MTDGKAGKRKKVLKAMPEDNFFRAFFSSPAALAITRVADGKFININPSYTNIMGYQPDDILGLTVDDLNIYIDSGERDLLIKTLHEHGEVRNYELNVRSKSGEVRNLLVSMVPTIYDNEEAIISTFIDITARKTAEERVWHFSEVHIANKRVNQLINREKDPEALIRKVCSALTETRGYRSAWICILDRQGVLKVSADSGIGPDFDGLKAQFEKGELPACCLNAFANRDVLVIRSPMRTCRGCMLRGSYGSNAVLTGAIRHAGRDYGVLTVTVSEEMADDPEEKDLFRQVITDIGIALDSIEAGLERNRAEEELKRSEYFYRALFENMLNGFAYCRMIYDGEKPLDFVYLSVNRAFETQTGLKDVAGKRVSEVIPGICETDPGLFEIYGRVARSGIPEVFETYIKALKMWFEVTVYSPGRDYFVAVFNVITERKVVEIRLRESEERFRNLFENMSSGVAVYEAVDDGRDFVFRDFNAAGEVIEGVSRERVIGRRVTDVFPGVDEFGLLDIFRQVWKTGTVERQHVSQYKDGRISGWRENYVYRLPSGEVVAIYNDVTERKLAEVALVRSEEKYRELVENLNDVIYVTDREGVMTYVSPTSRMVTGYDPEELTGRTFHFLIHPDDLPVVENDFSRTLEKRHEPSEFRYITRDGRIRWARTSSHSVIENGVAIGIQGVFSDITDRRKVEDELRESEERFRALVDLAPDGILVHADGLIMYVNPAMVNILGVEGPDDLIGSDFMEKIASEYHDEFLKRLQIQSETGRPVPAMEQEFIRSDGTRVPVESIAAPLRFRGRDAHLVFVRDITLRKKSDEDRTNLQSQLQQSQKMEAIGRLAGGVAHDFNNLLTVIIGWSELEMNRLHEDDPLKKRLGEILNAGKSAASLTRQLLAFSRRQPQNPEVVNINESIRSIEKMLIRLIGENVELTTKLEDGLYRVTVDKGQIEQVLMNIIINANDAMPSGGRIAIETRNLELDEVSSGFNPEAIPGSYVMVSVNDSGTGMDKETMERIFDPFFTTKELGKGTGLGLSTVYGIIKQSGGFIDVSSRKGVGTVFRIFLPKSEKERGQAGDRQEEFEVIKGAGILIVEDSTAVRNLAVRMLKDAGYTVSEASSPEEALSFMKDHGEIIDLVVSDIMMPGMTGPEMMERLAADYPGLRRLYMSGYTEQIASFSDTLGDYSNFISKPFRRVDFLGKIRSLLKEETLS